MPDETQETSHDNTEEVSAEEKLYDKDAKAEEGAKDSEKPEGEAQEVEADDSGKEDKQGEEQQEFELKKPENFALDDEAFEGIANFAKEQGLSKEQAEAVVKRENQLFIDQMQALDDRKAEWAQMAQDDKEIGGKALKEHAELAKRVVKTFGSESLFDELDKTGFGNHPEVIKLFSRVGKLLSEDDFVHPDGKTTVREKSMEDVFYGETTGGH